MEGSVNKHQGITLSKSETKNDGLYEAFVGVIFSPSTILSRQNGYTFMSRNNTVTK